MATFSELTGAEQAWLQTLLENTRRFVGQYSPEDVGDPLQLEALDRAWAAWVAEEIEESEAVNAAIDAIGFGFGAILVEVGGFAWTIATDDYGTDWAVRALPDRGDMLVYPANFVAKRWRRKETKFLVNACEVILRTVAQTKAKWDAGEFGS